jgi:hypothetical protein
VSCQEPVSICFSSLGAKALMWTTKLQKWDPLGWDWWHCKVWALHLSGGCILQYAYHVSMQQVGQLMDCYSFVLKWSSTAMFWNVFIFFLKVCTKMHLGEVNLNGHVFNRDICKADHLLGLSFIS